MTPREDFQRLSGITRREMLVRSGMGFGMLGLAGVGGVVCGDDQPVGYTSPMAPKSPHFPVKAKRVIHLFMNGGPSHVDTFRLFVPCTRTFPITNRRCC